MKKKEEIRIEFVNKVKTAFKSMSLRAGDEGYLLSCRWFNKWKKYIGYDGEPDTSFTLTAINNEHLMAGKQIKFTILQDYDYVLLDENLWQMFKKKYRGGPEICVPIIENPQTKLLEPVIVQWVLTVHYEKQKVDFDTSKYEKVGDFKERVCEHFEIDPKKSRLIDYWNKNRMAPLIETKNFQELHILNTQELLLEFRTSDGWGNDQRKKKSFILNRTNSSMASGIIDFVPPDVNRTSGLVGLVNMGNTCYFNAAIQALAHTKMLVKFFEFPGWRRQVNEKSRLGTGGVLANYFAQLVDDIWTKDVKVLNPDIIKKTIDNFNQRFVGNGQHDAQEMLMVVMDLLSEDLNRVKTKPYLESVVGDGTDDAEIADEAWKRHKMVQDSVIVDIFHAQMRNDVTCDRCGNHSVVFDPYACVTLPVVDQRSRLLKYCFVPLDCLKPRRVVKIETKQSEDTDEEFMMSDCSQRFGVEKVIIIDRGTMLEEFRISPPSILVKCEYFIFEIRPRKKYSLFNVAFAMAKGSGSPVAGPMLIEVKARMDLQKSFEERLSYLWDAECPLKATGVHRQMEARIANGANMEAPKINPKSKWDKYSIEDASEHPWLSAQSFRVELGFAFAKEGFQWGAVLPIDRSLDTSVAANAKKSSLESCLKQLAESLHLDEQNEWFCPRCKKMVKASTDLTIWSVPDVLIIQLKRFVQSNNEFHKLTTFVECPHLLDMRPHLTGPQQETDQTYRLFAVINHMGIMNGGHYTASALCERGGGWFTFNDDAVYRIDESEVITDAAYVLLYERIHKD